MELEMRKLIFIIFLLGLLFSCAQKIGVGIDADYEPEIIVKTGQKYPELQVQEIIKNIRIKDKIFPLETKNGETLIKIPNKYGKLLKQGKAESVDNKEWEISYNREDEILYILPPLKTLRIECKKQSQENFADYIAFTKKDFDSLFIY